MLRPVALTVDDQVRPLATRESPRFGWLLEWAGHEPAHGSGRQAAYQIRVTDSSHRVLWDTGRVESGEQRHIPYAGPPLEPGASYSWTVRVWAEGFDAPSEWAPAEPFACGLRDADWEACWIRRRPGGLGPLAEVDGVLRAAGGETTLLHGVLPGRDDDAVRAQSGDGETCDESAENDVSGNSAGRGFAVEFGIRVRIRSGGWALTDDSGRNGLVWRLTPQQGMAIHVLRGGDVGPADLVPAEIRRGDAHRIVLRAQNGLLQVSVDGIPLDRRPEPMEPEHPLRRFGVYQRHGEEAEFFDLTLRVDGRAQAADDEVVLAPECTGRLDAWENTSEVRQIDEWTLARREFELRDVPLIRARAYLASHHHADLYVNGERVGGRGAFAYPGEGYYQVVDLTERLADVRRAAVGVWLHWYGNGQGRPAGEPGLLVRIVLDYADGARQVVVSDGSWKVREGPYVQAGYRNDEGDPIEHLDLRAIPDGWDRPGFADDDWAPAEVVGPHPTPPFTRLRPQETRLAEVPVRPVALRIADDGTPVADFGRVIPARPVVRFSRGKAGRVVRIRAGYNLTETGRVATSTLLTQGTDMSFPCTQTDGAQTYRAFTHLGFRYLEIPDAGEDLGIDDIGAVVVYAEPPAFRPAAEFASSDPTLDAVVDLLRRSALYGVQEQFVDTPTREKGQFLADAVNISYATMTLFGERASTRQAIREFLASAKRYWQADDERGRYNAVYPNGDGKRDIPDFSLMMPEWVRRYHLESGDVELVAEAYPALRDTAGYVLRHIPTEGPCAGLVTDLAGGGGPYLHGIVDWPAVGRFGYDMATSARTTVNAQAVGVLRDVAHLGRVLGRPDNETAWYDEQADRLTEAVNHRLLRPDGRYADGLYADGGRSPHASQHATSFALAFGLVPPEARKAAADHIEALGMRQGPMTAHRLLQAHGREGRVDAVLRLLTDADDLGWARILAQGGTFTWEAWTLDEGTNHSQSHGWGAQAAVDVVEFLLGVRITVPGGAEIEVRPPRCALTYARGSVPTERGVVRVEWRRVDDDVRVRVEVPPNVRARVHLPSSPGR